MSCMIISNSDVKTPNNEIIYSLAGTSPYQLDTTELPAGDYELRVTPVGNPDCARRSSLTTNFNVA